MPLSLSDVIVLSDSVLFLSGRLREMFIEVMEATDETVLEYTYKKNSAKLEEMTAKQNSS